MIDLKYHIYSLVAIFIALAIGVLVGISVGGGPSWRSEAINKQSQAIQRLRGEFKNYSDKIGRQQAAIDDLTSDLKEADALVAPFLPSLLAGALAGRGAAIIQLGQADDLSLSVRKTLKMAGAVANSVTRIDTKFSFNDAQELAKAAKVLPLEYQDPSKEPYQQLWGFVASTLSSGRGGKPFEALQSAGVLQQLEGSYAKPNKYLILVTPSGILPGDIIDALIKPLIERVKMANLGVVLTAASTPLVTDEAGTSGSAWRQLDIATVTHADTSFGQICLVEALVTGEGHYGLGASETLAPKRFIAH